MLKRAVPRRVREVQELRRSNAATPVPSGRRYTKRDRSAWKREIRADLT